MLNANHNAKLKFIYWYTDLSRRKQLPSAGRSKLKGQTMMEYIILVGLLAVASIPIAKILGDVFRDRVLRAADEIAGSENYQSGAGQMVQGGRSKVKRTMKDF